MYIFINKGSISKFYKTLKFTGFKKISQERKDELDIIVSKYEYYFKNMTDTKLALMSLLADRLITSSKTYGLLNGDEQAYFFVKMIDPELNHLALYEASNKIEDIKNNAIKDFNFYDKNLIILEKYLNERFHEYDVDDLWSRDSIKR